MNEEAFQDITDAVLRIESLAIFDAVRQFALTDTDAGWVLAYPVSK